MSTGGGYDPVNSGDGNDTINTGAVPDHVNDMGGSWGKIDLGSGNDDLHTTARSLTVRAGPSLDQVISRSPRVRTVRIWGGCGNDIIILPTSLHSGIIDCGLGNDALTAFAFPL